MSLCQRHLRRCQPLIEALQSASRATVLQNGETLPNARRDPRTSSAGGANADSDSAGAQPAGRVCVAVPPPVALPFKGAGVHHLALRNYNVERRPPQGWALTAAAAARCLPAAACPPPALVLCAVQPDVHGRVGPAGWHLGLPERPEARGLWRQPSRPRHRCEGGGGAARVAGAGGGGGVGVGGASRASPKQTASVASGESTWRLDAHSITFSSCRPVE